ncbi:MAG TPA: hypothetical protein VLH39_03690, partial [Magnetospirillaceae bacterium]|nr:hypothetical protein [Magnetospirillaceae bacterium]
NPDLPPDVSRLFDDAIDAARTDKADEVLRLCQQIEAYFNFPEPDAVVRHAQIPGGMYSNMMAQLKEAHLEQHLNEVLVMVPKVRLDSGVPPLVTPTSQIVGVQAVNCVIDQIQGKPFYTNVSKNFVELVKGTYGKTPWPVDPEFRMKIAGVREETPFDTSEYRRQENPELPEYGLTRLALDEKEELLLELFPSVADKYLRSVRAQEWAAWLEANPPAPEPEILNGPWPAVFWEDDLTACAGA